MRNSKKIILISIIVLIVLILIAGGAFAYTYFFTDAFLSNQEKFMKYISEDTKEIGEFFNEENIESYFSKKKNEAYTSNGEVSFELSGGDEDSQQALQILNNFKLSLAGNTDLKNNYVDQQIALKYSDNDLVSGDLIFRQEYMGLKVNDIINQYIVLENNNLQQFAQNMGITDYTEIPNQISISELLQGAETISFTDDELTQIKDRYLKVITDNLTEDMFSNQEYENGQVYTLTINEEKATQILTGLINELKNDDIIMNKIKQVYMQGQSATEEEANQLIEQFKSELDSIDLNSDSQSGISLDNQTSETTQTEPEEMYIKVYVSDKNTEKIEVEIPELGKVILTTNANQINVELQQLEDAANTTYKTLGKLIIDKTKEDDNLSYNFSVVTEDNTKMFGFTMSYTGLSNMSNVQESYAIDLSGAMNIFMGTTQAILTVDTSNSVEKDNVALVMNELVAQLYEDNYINGEEFQINVSTIQEALNEHGYNMTVTQNAEGTFDITSNDTGNVYTVDSSGNIINEQENTSTENDTSEDTIAENNISFIINYNTSATFGQITQKEVAENERMILNDRDAEFITSLFNTLGQKIEEKVTTEMTSQIANSVNNQITNQGDNSVDNQITNQENNESNNQVDEQTSNTSNSSTIPDLSEQEKEAFNSKFTTYEGQGISGAQVNMLIQTIIASNQVSDMKVSITYPDSDGNEVTISDSSNTTNARVETGNTYTVTMEYQDGFINKITVTQN